MKMTATQSVLFRMLSTMNPKSKMDLIQATGWSERTLLKCLAALMEHDEVIRIALPDHPQYGAFPVVFMRTYDDYRMRLSNSVLRARAQPRLDALSKEAVRKVTAVIADRIRARKERERREAYAQGYRQEP